MPILYVSHKYFNDIPLVDNDECYEKKNQLGGVENGKKQLTSIVNGPLSCRFVSFLSVFVYHCLFVCLCLSLSILSNFVSLYLSLSMFIYLCLYLCLSLSICLPIIYIHVCFILICVYSSYMFYFKLNLIFLHYRLFY